MNCRGRRAWPDEGRDLHRAAEDLLERALADVKDEAGDAQVDRQVGQGAAAEVLVSAATPGDLLVVGSRGQGGFAPLMLGSVSQQCVHYPPCPVVVIHPAKPSGSEDESGDAKSVREPAIA